MHYDERITKRWEHKGNDLLYLLFLRHTRRLQRGGNYLSLSLSLTRSVQLTLYNYNIHQQQHNKSMCPKSYLYIYDFLAYLHMCPSQSVRTDRNRFLYQPVLCIFHPEGHVSQQTPPSLRHGMSFQTDVLPTHSQLVGCQHLGQHV